MSSFLLAQIVGAVGYGLLVLATFARSRRRFLVVDFVGLAPVAVHYVMLGAAAGAALSVFYMAFDAIAGLAARRLARQAYWLFYPSALMIGWLLWSGPADALAMAGTILAIAARHNTRLWRIQALVFASTVGWGLFGVAAGSAAQVGFSVIYGGAALLNTIRLVRGDAAASGRSR